MRCNKRSSVRETMKKRLARIMLLVAAASTAAASSGAQLGHGSEVRKPWLYEMPEFYSWCRSPDPRGQQACKTYVCAVADALAAECLFAKTWPHPFCLPAGS